jgi:type IV pilus assembly protein PilQ
MSKPSVRLVLVVAVLLAVGTAAHAQQAYCYVRDVKVTPLSNGVQIQVKADGILNWMYASDASSSHARYGEEVSQLTIRFPEARLEMDKTLYDVEQPPVSTVVLAVPQDAVGGMGVAMTVQMSEASRVKADTSEDRQSFLLTVYSSRTIERSGKGEAGVADLKEGSIDVKPGAEGRLSVRAIRADIHQVVAQVARAGKFGVAVDDAVQRKVSLNLQDRTALDIVRGIAVGYGLALSNVGDMYMLSEGVPTDLPTYRRSGTASFPTRYLKAKDAAQLLPTFLFKYLHDNPEQNAVVVTAPTQMLAKIERDLKAIDVPPPMIMVECAVVELTDANDLDAQFRWQYQSTEYDAGTDSGTGDVDYTNVQPSNGLVSAIVPAPILQAWLQALTTKGRAEVNAHPSMAAVNGKNAEIFIGSERYIKISYLSSGVQQERIEKVPVGVRLQVRPWTGGNQEITTGLHVEVSNIVELDPATGVPKLSSREASSTLRTRDGDIIVIGGLSQRQQEKTWRRIPILGDLPLIGKLFRSRSTRASNTELVILIRPRLLDENGRLPVDEDCKIRQEFLLPGELGCPNPTEIPVNPPAK